MPPPPFPGPRRHRALHWAALVLSIVSLWLLLAQVARGGAPDPFAVRLDLALGGVFAFEFFTRSGWRWNKWSYVPWHFFDFIAMVPALALVGQGLPGEGVWIWLVLLARIARVGNRLVGDGFVEHAIRILVEGFEEELTDRVLLRILNRTEARLVGGEFGRGVSGALQRHREAVLASMREQHPTEGLAGTLARLGPVEEAMRRAEEGTFDALTGFLGSEAVDQALREVVTQSFDNARREIQQKEWRKRLLAHLPKLP